MSPITIHRAAPADADAVVAIVRDNANWLRERGSPQWRIYLTDEGERSLRDHIAGTHNAEVYLALREQIAVGTFCLEWTDSESWEELGTDGTAGYIFTVAVTPALRGQKIGQQLLSRAENLIADRPRTFARLDCWAGNPKLVDYYTARGYAPAGLKNGPNGCQLFEKSVVPFAPSPGIPGEGWGEGRLP